MQCHPQGPMRPLLAARNSTPPLNKSKHGSVSPHRKLIFPWKESSEPTHMLNQRSQSFAPLKAVYELLPCFPLPSHRPSSLKTSLPRKCQKGWVNSSHSIFISLSPDRTSNQNKIRGLPMWVDTIPGRKFNILARVCIIPVRLVLKNEN